MHGVNAKSVSEIFLIDFIKWKITKNFSAPFEMIFILYSNRLENFPKPYARKKTTKNAFKLFISSRNDRFTSETLKNRTETENFSVNF